MRFEAARLKERRLDGHGAVCKTILLLLIQKHILAVKETRDGLMQADSKSENSWLLNVYM